MLISTTTLHSLVVIQGDATTAPYGFTAPITTTVLQKSTGTLFIGLGIGQLTTNFSIAKALRPNFISTPKFIGIAIDPTMQGKDIEFLTVSDQIKGKAILPFVMATINNFEAKNVSAIFDNGSSFTQTIALNDANEETTQGIVQLATSMAITTTTNNSRSSQGISYVFAAVRPNAGDFGDVNSGIALMSLTSTGTTINFNTLDAQTGQTGNLAELLDATSTELKGDSGGGDVIFSTGDDANRVALYYDDIFTRLYIGVRIATGATTGDIGKSVVVGRVDTDGLILEPITPDNTIDPTFDQIVVAENEDNVAGPNLRANHLSVMHTSAGPSYLIVQGGIGQTNEVGNTIFALPLVDDPSDPSTHGTLANKNAPLDNFKFVTPATLPSQLADAGDPAAFVGGGTLPMVPSDQISDMVVVGDAVFISIELEPTADNDTGILYSQALFDAEGKIINWTPWTKRASPIDLFPQITPSVGGGVQFFEVDASTGNIYITTNNDQNLVGITAWTEHISTSTASDTPIPLINALNTVLPDGSYSVLDLPQSVRGFTATTTAPNAPLSRYALFGGVNTVAFARISEADTTAPDSPQTVITDFDNAENFLLTKLPAESGCVQVVEYSRRTSGEDDTNYFFAGTENGLFTFADKNGEGFNVDELAALDQPPFTNGRWHKIPEIKGSVIDIKSSGLALYVLTFETSAETPLKNTLYAISFEPTLEEMFRPFSAPCMNLRIIAQTNTDPVFGNTELFTGIQIIATGDPADVTIAADKEQLILATNQGLYKSNANQERLNRGIACADDQVAASWEIVPTTTNTMYTGISGIETPIRHTTWPLRVQGQACRSFDASSVEQLSGNGDGETGEVGFAPTFFNADIDTAAFQNLEPITYFFSDGGRRFFILNPTATSSSHTQLSVIPFDAQAWHLTSPQTLKYPPLPSIERFFWVQTIGMSGFVLAGTDRGVIGLG